MSPEHWRFACASVIGVSHVATDAPCQDHHASRVLFSSSGAPILIAVVSDGAGSAEHADKGAAIVCRTLLEQAELFFSQQSCPTELSSDIGRSWFNEVRAAIASRAAQDQLEMRDFACTLLMAVLGTTSSLFMQIGDGAMVTSDDRIQWSWVFWPSKGEFANTTYFVTDTDATDRLMVETGGVVDEIALFTDGIEPLVLHYASRTVHSPFFANMFEPVRMSLADGEDAALSEHLRLYLNSPVINSRTDDDKTLVVASRQPPFQTEIVYFQPTD